MNKNNLPLVHWVPMGDLVQSFDQGMEGVAHEPSVQVPMKLLCMAGAVVALFG